MNRTVVTLIKETATLKNIVLLGLLFLLMAFFILPEATKQIKQYAGETNLIDGKFHFSSAQMYDLLSNYGEKCRYLYLVVELTAGLFFSIVTTAFLGLLLIWSAFRSRNRAVKIKYLLWIPGLLLIVSILKNTTLAWLLYNYPEQYPLLALSISLISLCKWILTICCLVLVLWNLLRIAILKSKLFTQVSMENSSSNHL